MSAVFRQEEEVGGQIFFLQDLLKNMLVLQQALEKRVRFPCQCLLDKGSHQQFINTVLHSLGSTVSHSPL